MTLLSSHQTDHAAAGGFDAFLGAGRDRFLGDGHRRVGLALLDLIAVGDTASASTARVTYPDDWSLKAGGSREAHLSTVDAIRVAEEVRSALASGPMPWLKAFGHERSLTVRAGAEPFTALEAVPVQTSVARPDVHTVRLLHRVGSLKVESEWVRSEAQTPSGSGWRAGRVTQIALAANSNVSCFYEREASTLTPMSFLEILLLTAQMSQVALYEGDPGRRDQSGNMWMRRAQFLRTRSSDDRVQQISTRLENRRVLSVSGRQFTTVDVRADDIFGVQVTASLASGS
jgi:hypothetical protein